jgi:predicted HAD superfamily Cof-like phosphohydrolase
MKELVKKVSEFHQKYGFSVDRPLVKDKDLLSLSHRLARDAENVRQVTDAAVRAHLVLEEVSEMLASLVDGDRVALLDALADLVYVIVGTAVTFGLPLAAAVEAVHVSNMSKTIERDRPGHPGKGGDYRPPDLACLLEEAR